MELYNNLIELLEIQNLNNAIQNDKIKAFILNNSVNDLILNYEELTKLSILYEDKQVLFRSVFYDNIANYIMKNNFHSIKNIKVIFLFFSYISPNKMNMLIQYLYPLLDNVNKDYFHYEMLIIIYTVMLNKDTKMNNKEYYELLNNLYQKKIIQNPLYSNNEEKSSEDYVYISLFDFFVHTSYICENYDVSLIFMKLIMNILESLNNDELMNFYSTTVNIDSLYTLIENVTNDNEDYLNIIEKQEKDNNVYINTFTYFVSKLFIHMKKYNLILKHSININEKDENINDLVNYYYTNILYGENRKNNYYLKMGKNFDSLESNDIINDLFKVNNKIQYVIFIDSFNKSKNDITPVCKVFMIMIWLRFIYFKINKNTNQFVSYDSIKKKYYIKKLNKEIVLERKSYINDIILYMNEIHENEEYTYNFLIENIKQFVLYDYVEMVQKCNSCQDKSCSICLEEVTNTNINICYYCNKVFHDSCINEVWKNGHDECPLCRKYINNSFYTYSNMRYEFLKDILDKINL